MSTAFQGHGPRPALVDRSLRFLQEHEVWHLTSQNQPARSCREAARQRRRLGAVGIPLCDELKSLLYAYDDADSRRYVLLHCRAHQRLDLAKVVIVVGACVQPVTGHELSARFGAQYGTVTPFLFADLPNVRQVFDDTVVAPFYPPYTVMTNSGDLEHAVELHAADLVRVLPRTVVRDIVADEDKRVPRHRIGIVTGNSPESGMLLWQKINGVIRADPRVHPRGDAGFPRIIVDSVPAMGSSMELPQREPDVRPVVVDAVRGLCEAGATVVGLACNTTQHFAREIDAICDGYGARFVPLAEALRTYLQSTHTTTFDLLGIGSVADLDGWSGFGPALAAFDVHVPERGQAEAITQLAFRVKREVDSPSSVNRLRDLISHATKTETVVVALTELSILLSRQKGRPRSGKRIIDTLDILASSMAEFYLEERIATGGA